jgi:hypothetical protein
MTPEQKQQQITEAINSCPNIFGLRAFPGETFRVSRTSSYWSDHENGVMLYTEIKVASFGNAWDWKSFAKGTPEELRREIVAAPGAHPFKAKVRAFPSSNPLFDECATCGHLKTHHNHTS